MTPTVIVTGSAGLVGSESVRFFCEKGFRVIGIDNDMRRYFFGDTASTQRQASTLQEEWPNLYTHVHLDVRDEVAVDRIFGAYNAEIRLVIHAAAQPSHDWAATEPLTDFSVNATATFCWKLPVNTVRRQYFCLHPPIKYTETNRTVCLMRSIPPDGNCRKLMSFPMVSVSECQLIRACTRCLEPPKLLLM